MTKKNMTVMGQGFFYAENSQNGINELSFAEMLPVIQSTISGQAINGVSAKALHKALGIETRLTDWIKRHINEYGFIQGIDYQIVETLSYSNLGSAKSRQQVTGLSQKWLAQRVEANQ